MGEGDVLHVGESVFSSSKKKTHLNIMNMSTSSPKMRSCQLDNDSDSDFEDANERGSTLKNIHKPHILEYP
jgi:hypothetical protein